MRTAGFCIGASNISFVLLEHTPEPRIVQVKTLAHEGNPRTAVQHLLESCPGDLKGMAVTGKKFKDNLNLSTVSEPEATELAYGFLQLPQEYDAVVSAGGETLILYRLNKGLISNVVTGNKCASGTGEFFIQQVKRMGLTIEEAVQMAHGAEPYPVAGRCSVFCKSDCTHALNKGESKAKVVAGLSRMMSVKIVELAKLAGAKRIVLVGGTSKNSAMIEFLKQELLEVYIPQESAYFEALGAGLWANLNITKTIASQKIFKEKLKSFTFLSPLKNFSHKVEYKEMIQGKANINERCLLGLDVGSTTTKAVLISENELAILAKVYLRTNGDPIDAAKRCYAELATQVPEDIRVIGIGVTGSGRQIAGLHALTECVVNEIIAHATAAVYFDPDVDTIFEIGGQDAKYTYLENQVPCDYAMNEACSAGTGSFLEESAKETLLIETTEIAAEALKATNPPNFSDQCAAFISSDIKNAIHEGITKSDIAAGLVYSICQNYINRVKSNRLTGKKIFMQGGVCYNKAVPLAMAALLDQEIIVPPEPGLMGAFGVALETKQRLDSGLLNEKEFKLKELAQRKALYHKPFICGGQKENCDRKCKINIIEVAGHKYPFGGACNKYVNLINHSSYNVRELDFVLQRENLVFQGFANEQTGTFEGLRIGISKSFFTNTYYPLYYKFFTELGCNPVIAQEPYGWGQEQKGAAFCYPAELAHGFCQYLIEQDVDYYFYPQLKGLAIENGVTDSVTCPFAQGEPYYLKSTFPQIANKMLKPVLDFSKPVQLIIQDFVGIGQKLGFSKRQSRNAFFKAWDIQNRLLNKFKTVGSKLLEELEQDPNKIAIVLLGRPYNAFTLEANMGIPAKFASRGYLIMPCDYLPLENEAPDEMMYWAVGQLLLKSAKFIANHPQLFAVYISNFSCGPDSFLINYVRNILGRKPSLTLELDSHTADAGVDTRIEAFLDVVKRYRQNMINTRTQLIEKPFTLAKTLFYDGKFLIKAASGQSIPLQDPKIRVIIPAMGEYSAAALAATFRYVGVNALCLEPPSEFELKEGKKHTSCKECLPLLLTIGSLKRYLAEERQRNEITVFFMPTTSGPCRFGQYHVAIEQMLVKEQINDVALFSLSSSNGYAGLPLNFIIRAWRAAIIGDVLEEIYNTLLVLAEDQEKALKVFQEVKNRILQSLEEDTWTKVVNILQQSALLLGQLSRKGTLANSSKVLLVGEIYVRKDGFSRQYLEQKLADKGIVLKVAPITEWLYYCDYLLRHSLTKSAKVVDKIRMELKTGFQRYEEKRIKDILARSGLCSNHHINIEKSISNASEAITPTLTGEAVLTVGGAVSELVDEVEGVIAIGPFGCMPNRIAEAILNKSLTDLKTKSTYNSETTNSILARESCLPFLALESDGNSFPQVIDTKLEAFCLQVKRLATLTKN